MTPQSFKALTISSNGGFLRAITCPCGVAVAFDPTKTAPIAPKNLFNGLWDTGATGSAITQKVVDDCGLKPTRLDEVSHGGGKQICEFYLISLYLPNGLVIASLEAPKLEVDGAHVLIGMDVFNAGDTTICNFNNRTVFSFRVPSLGAVDYVDLSNQLTKQAPRKGFRQPKKRRH